MKKQSYMSPQERDDYIQLKTFNDFLEDVTKRTPVPTWQRKLKTAHTYIKNILEEREACQDKVDYDKVQLRREKTNIYIYTRDEARMLESRLGYKDKTFKMDAENWVTMCMAIDNFICRKCKQGDKVKNCEIRQILHKSFAPVYVGDPKEGECEFHWDSNCKDLDIEVEEDEG